MFKKREVKGKGIRRKREEDSTSSTSLGPDMKVMVKGDEEEDNTSVVRDGIGSSRKRVNAFSTGGGSGYKKDGDTHLGALLAVESLGASKVEFGGSATATNDIDTAHDHDARAIAEKNLLLQQDGGDVNEDGSKIYRGQAGYKNFITKDESQIGNNKNTGTQGPIRAPAFFRTTCRFDYQPDICKDYKDTGFCGFGDSCKFMHDRGNYKTGYQMEKEWDEKQAERKRLISMGIDPDEEEGKEGDSEFEVKAGPDLPFACYICRGPFIDPIQTVCSHYFCQKCAVKQFRSEGPNCPICAKNTAGIFNGARKLTQYAKTKGGFQKLFALESRTGNEEGQEASKTTESTDFGGENNTAATLAREEEESTSVTAGGTWAVVDVEEEGQEGVGDLLSEEANQKEEEEKKKAEEAKEEATKQAATNATKSDTMEQQKQQQEKLVKLAASVGWMQVHAHGQVYWFNQSLNMTSRDIPAQVSELL